MNNSKKIHIGIIVGASLCLILTIFSVIQFRRVRHAENETTKMRTQSQAIRLRIEQSKDQLLVKEATSPAVVNEEANFISGLKTMAKDTKITIVKWSVVGSQGNEEKGKKTKNEKEKDLLEGVISIAGHLEVEGDYKSVLRFTDRLLSAPRLYNLSFVSMVRGDERKSTRVSMMVTRYTEQPKQPVMEGEKV